MIERSADARVGRPSYPHPTGPQAAEADYLQPPNFKVIVPGRSSRYCQFCALLRGQQFNKYIFLKSNKRTNLPPPLSDLNHFQPLRSSHCSNEANKIPETTGVTEGSSKRNIVRKHDHDPNRKEKKQHGGGGGKGKWNDLNDGSM